MRERIGAMKAIWTNDEASYHGKFVDFDRIWSWPKPAQRPHPPVLIGGDGPTVLDRVLAYGDGWFPHWHDPGPRAHRELRVPRRPADRSQMFSVPADPHVLEQARAAGVHRVSVAAVGSAARGRAGLESGSRRSPS